MKKLVLFFDLDATICTSIRRYHPEDILKVKPRKIGKYASQSYIDIIRKLKKKGHKIVIYTRRGCLKNGRKLTKKWLKKYNVPYDKLITKKPHYNLLIDDRAFSIYQSFLTAEIIENQAIYSKKQIIKHTYKPKRRLK